MRLLFLTCHLPCPRLSGGRLREYELLRRLAGEVEFHVCAVSKTYDEDVARAAELRRLGIHVEVFRARTGCGDGVASQVARHASAEAARRVEELVSRGAVDAVHVEGFYLMPLVPTDCPVPILLVEQNVELDLWRQRVDRETDRDRRRAAFLEHGLTRAAELAAWGRADLCATVTTADLDRIARLAPTLDLRVVPDGADHIAAHRSHPRPNPRTVAMVANFAYEPNACAAAWFCSEILPRLTNRIPGVHLQLVGSGPPAHVRALAGGNVTVTGPVPAVEPYLDRAAVVVCPLRVGGGIKVKVLEALSRGKAIVTTSIGAQGLPGQIARCGGVEDDPARFADAVAALLADRRRRERCEQESLALAATLPTWDDAAVALLGCYGELRHDAERVA